MVLERVDDRFAKVSVSRCREEDGTSFFVIGPVAACGWGGQCAGEIVRGKHHAVCAIDGTFLPFFIGKGLVSK